MNRVAPRQRLSKSVIRRSPLVLTPFLAVALVVSSSFGGSVAGAQDVSRASVAGPASVAAVATPQGTEVFITPPSSAMVVAPMVAPTSYEVSACGPYSMASVQMSQILANDCAGDTTTTTTTVAADKLSLDPAAVMTCVPSEQSWCLIVVHGVNGALRTTSIRVGSGGVAPNSVTGLTATSLPDGHGVTLNWTAGAPATQAEGIPALVVAFEVRRDKQLLATGLTQPTFTDASCGSARRCTYEVAATSPAGRTPALPVSAVTLGDAPPSVDALGNGISIPGLTTVTGALGQGSTDQRPVTVNFTPEGGGTTVTAPATTRATRWTAMVPALLTAGRYRVTASQGGHESTATTGAFARDIALSAEIPGGALVVGPGTVTLEGQGVPSSVASSVGVTDALVPSGTRLGALSQAQLATTFAEIPGSRRSPSLFAPVDANGAWQADLSTGTRTVGLHLVKITQSLPGGTTHILYLPFGVTAQAPSMTSQPSVPQPPTISMVTPGVARIAVTWKTPSSGRDPVTTYRVWAVEDPSKVCTINVDVASANTCIVDGLTAGRRYSFRATALSNAGASAPSTASAAAAPTGPPATPAAPTAVPASGSAKVSWTAPAANGSPITSYKVIASPGNKSCTTTTTSCTVSGLLNGTAYTFTVSATNAIGTTMSPASAPVTPASAPTAPAAPSVTPGNASVSATWTPSAENGSPITSYKVVASPSGKSCTTAGTSCTITGLTNGTPYTFTVAATNGVGTTTSAPSRSATPATVPGAPTQVVATGSASGTPPTPSMTVTWKAPTNTGGSSITSYVVTMDQVPTKTCTYTVGQTPANTCVISGLTRATLYSFTIVARNAMGPSAPSASSTLASTFSTPGAPTNIGVTGGDTTVTVTWTPPTNTGGSAITSYIVKQVYSSTVLCTYTVGQTPANSCTVKGMQNGRSMQFTVAAVNALGVGADSLMSLYVTVGVAPSSPTSVQGTPAGGSVNLSWTAPTSAGSKYGETSPGKSGSIIRYDVYILGGNGGPVCTKYQSGASPPLTSCSISNLTNGSSYNFIVVAMNDAGILSTPSSPSSAITPLGLAGAPTGFSVLASQNSANLSWTAPTDTGGAPITGYLVTARPPSGAAITQTFSASATSGMLTGLTPDVAYQVTIQAVTRAGSGVASDAVPAKWTSRPPIPVNVTIAPGIGSALVSWTQPASSSFPITSYTIRATDQTNARGTVSAVVSTNPGGISGLTPGDTYTFSVAATNVAGPSLFSAPTSAINFTPPPTPVNTSVSLCTFCQTPTPPLWVRWTAPDATGLSPITNYMVIATPSRGQPVATLMDSSLTQAFLYDLPAWTSYSISVMAISATGSSVPASVGTIMQPGPPLKPTGFTATSTGNGVHFTFDAANGDSPSAGTYEIRADDGTLCVVASGASSCDVTGSQGTTLTWTLVATNAWGTTSSDPITLTLTPLPPMAPEQLTVSGYGSETVSWIAPGQFLSWGLQGSDRASLPSWPRNFVARVVGDDTKSCSADAHLAVRNYSCVIDGLVPGQTYQFQVTSGNEWGLATSASLTAVVMDQPTTPASVSVAPRDGGLSASFAASSTPVSTITGYRVSADDGNGGVLTAVCSSSPCSVTGLTNGIAYAVSVVALNSLGGESVASDPLSVTPVVPPVAATNPRILSTGDGTVTLGFDVAGSPAAPIDHYLVTATDQTDSSGGEIESCPVTAADSTTDQCAVTGLVNGDTYVFSMVIVGPGGSSTTTTFGTPAIPAAVPSVPTISSVTAQPASAQLVFSPSQGNGAAVTGYVVRVTDLSSPASWEQPLSRSPGIVTGLTNGDQYQFEVAGINRQGRSAWSAASASVTPIDAPAAPSGIQAVGRNTVATLTFTAPPANGLPITGYAVSVISAWNNRVPTTVLLGPSLPLQVTGLHNGDSASFQVAAINTAGTSGWSAATDTIVIYGPPTPPILTQEGVYNANASATVYFRGGSWGFPARKYTARLQDVQSGDVISVDKAVSFATQAEPFVIPGLTNGRTYSLTMTTWSSQGESDPSNSVLVQPVGPPPAPIDVHATLVNGLIYVHWSEPANNSGSPIIQYSATAQNLRRSCLAVQVPSSTPPPPMNCVIVGADGIAADSITVVAQNAAGTSDPSTAVSTAAGSGPSTRISSPPTNVTLSGYGTQLLVTWNPPDDTGGGAITGYAAVVQPSGKTCTSVTSLSCWITDVDPYAIYTATVVATDSVGTSASSNPSPEGSVCGLDASACANWFSAPFGPSDVIATEVHGGVRVSWRSPDTTLTYQAVASPSGRSCTAQPGQLDATGRLSCVVPGDPGSFDRTEVFHAQKVFYAGPGGTVSSTSVHPTWWETATITTPGLVNFTAPHATGTITGSATSVTVVAAPISCNSPYNCPTSLSWTTPVSAGSYDVALTGIADGAYLVYVDGFDPVGGPSSLTVDTTPPTPLTIGPPPGIPTTILEPVASVVGTAECDATTSLALAWYSGSPATGSALVTTHPSRTSGDVCTYSDVERQLADGVYTVVASMTDRAGNSSSTTNVVTIDSSAPTPSFISPGAATNVPAGMVAVAGMSPAHLGDVRSVLLSAVSGTTTIRRVLPLSDSGAFSTLLSLNAGTWNLSIRQSDNAGNVATVAESVVVVAAPTTSIVAPTPGAQVAATSTVAGWASPGSTVSIGDGTTVLGTAVADTTGWWSRSVSFLSGQTTLVAKVGAGQASIPIGIGVPNAALSILPIGRVGVVATAPILGTGAPSSSVLVSIDGAAASSVAVSAAGIWTVSTTLFSQGIHTLVATAGLSTATATFTIDRTVPVVTISAPQSGSTNSRGVDVLVPSVAGDCSSVTLTYFAGPSTLPANLLEVHSIPVVGDHALDALPAQTPDGTVTIQASRCDVAGNTTTTTQTVTYDSAPPQLSSNLADFMPGPLTIRGVVGVAAGDQAATATIDGSPAVMTRGDGASYTVTTTLLGGSHLVVIRQQDAAGNSSVISRTLTVLSDPPSLTLDQQATIAMPSLQVSGFAFGNGGPVSVTVTPEDPTQPTISTSVTPDDSGRYSLQPLAQLSSPEGWWNVKVTRTDLAGNQTVRSVRLLVDRTPPSIALDPAFALSPSVMFNTSKVTITGTASSESWRKPLVIRIIRADGAIVDSAAVKPVNGVFSYSPPTSVMSDGAYSVRIMMDDPLYPIPEFTVPDGYFAVDTRAPQIFMDAATTPMVRWCGHAGVDARDLQAVAVRYVNADGTTAETAQVSLTNRLTGAFCTAPSQSGTYGVIITQLDAAGNLGSTRIQAATFDVAAPVVGVDVSSFQTLQAAQVRATSMRTPVASVSLTGTAGVAQGDAPTVTVSFTKVFCVDQGCNWSTTATVNATGRWAIPLNTMPAGSWQFVSVSQTDWAGRTGSFSPPPFGATAYQVVVNPKPQAPILTIGDASGSLPQSNVSVRECPTISGVPLSLSVSIYRGAATGTPLFIVPFSTAQAGSCVAQRFIDFGSLVTLDGTPILINGVYTLVASVSDPQGNVTESTISYTSRYTAPKPTLLGMTTPQSSQPVSSASVDSLPVLRGTGWINDFDTRTIEVFIRPTTPWSGYGSTNGFYSLRLTTTLQSDGTWSIPLPASVPSGDLTVTVQQGSGAVLGAITLTNQSPTIDSVTMQAVSATQQSLTISGTIPSDRSFLSGSVQVTSPTLTTPAICTSVTVTQGRWTCTAVGAFPDGVYKLKVTTNAPVGYTECSSYPVGDGTYACTWIDRTVGQPTSSPLFTSASLKGSLPVPVLLTPLNSPVSPITGQLNPTSGPITVTGAVSTAPGDLPAVTIKVYAGATASGTAAQTLTATVSSSTSQFSKLVTLPDGTWTLQVTQADSASNKGLSNSVTVLEDSTAPTLATTWPAASGATIATPVIYGTIVGGVGNFPAGTRFSTSLTSSSTQLAQVANQTTSVGTITYYSGRTATGSPVLVDPITTNPQRIVPAPSTQFVDTPALAAGTYTAVISAADLAGNTATKTMVLTVSPTASAALNASFTASTVDAQGAVGTLQGTVRLKAGFEQITISAQCSLGAGACPVPTGAVTLFDNGTPIGTALTLSQGQVSAVVAVRAGTGNHVLTLSYAGDATFRPSSATSLGTVVADPITPSSVTIQASTRGGAAGLSGLSVIRTYQASGYDGSGVFHQITQTCPSGATSISDASGAVVYSSPTSSSGPPSQSVAAGTQTMQVVSGAAGDCAAGTAAAALSLTASRMGQLSMQDPNQSVNASAFGWVGTAYDPATALVVGRDINLGVSLTLPDNFYADGSEPSTNIPVWILGPDGVRLPATKQLISIDPANVTWNGTAWVRPPAQATLHYTPATAGPLRLTVVAGGDRSGYAESRADLTLAIEPAALTMGLQFTPPISHPGQTQTARLRIGPPSVTGQVSFAVPMPGGGVTVLTPAVSCTSGTCSAPIALDSLSDATSRTVIAPRFTSLVTGRNYLVSSALPRSPWPSSLSLVAGASAPRGVRVTPSADGEITVDWAAPAANGSTITGYRVTTSAGPSCTAAASATSCAVRGLTDGIATQFSVQTLSTAGTSSPVTLSATASATPIAQDPNPLGAASPNSATRDQLLPVSVTLAFDAAMPAAQRTGTVQLTSNPWTSTNPYSGCGNGIANSYCSGTDDLATVDLATGTVTRSLSISNRLLASIPAASLARAGTSADALTSTATLSWTGNTLTIQTQLYIGGGPFDLNAVFVPQDLTRTDPATAGSQGNPAARITGVGAPVVNLSVASAVMTGGYYGPRGGSGNGAVRQLSFSGWNARNPQVGETAYVKAEADPIFFAPSDRQIGLALAEAVPAQAPVYVTPAFPFNQTFGSTAVTTLAASASSYDNSVSCSDCAVWTVRNLDPSGTDPRTGGGLTAGTSTLGVVAYSPGVSSVTGGSAAELGARLGITALPFVVNTWPTTQSTTASYSGSAIQVLTAARWVGMSPEVQTSLGDVAVSITLNHAGTSTMVGYCFYSGVCLADDGNGQTFLPATVVTIGPRLSISIDASSLGYALSSDDSVTVTTSSPWGVDAVSSTVTKGDSGAPDVVTPSVPLTAPTLGGVTGTSGSVSATGTWLGATLQTPQITSPWPFLGWSVYNGAHDFFVSLFGNGATTRFLMGLTGFLWSTAIQWIATGGPFDPLGDLEVIAAAKAAVSEAMAATKIGRLVTKINGLGGAFKKWAISKLPARVGAAMSRESGPLSRVFKAFLTNTGGYAYDQYASDWVAGQATAGLNSVSSRLGIEPGTISRVNENVTTALATPVKVFDPSYTPSPARGSILAAALKAASNDSTSQALGNFSKAIQRAYSDAAGDEAQAANDVGYGPGIAIEVSQIFSAVIAVSVPSAGSYDLSASTLEIRTTRNPFEYGPGADPTAPNRDDSASLGSCTLAGVCTMPDGLTATVFKGKVVIAGQYPAKIAWAPSGAWLVLKLNLVTTAGGQGPVVWNRANIPFQGQQYDCWGAYGAAAQGSHQQGLIWETCDNIAGAQRSAGTYWPNGFWKPTGQTAWNPSPTYDTTQVDSPTTQSLIGGF